MNNKKLKPAQRDAAHDILNDMGVTRDLPIRYKMRNGVRVAENPTLRQVIRAGMPRLAT